MNPAIVFKHQGTALIARVTPESVAPYLADPKQLKKLVEKAADRIGYDTDWRSHEVLPIGDELSGRWVGSSPMGQGFTNPPIAWMFEERVKNATTSEIHSVMIMPQVFSAEDATSLQEMVTDKKKRVGVAEIEVKAIVTEILGEGALVEVQQQKMRDAISDFFDSWDGSTC